MDRNSLTNGGAPAGMLVDLKGNPIPPGEDRQRAEEELKNFMEKHKKRFEEYWQAYGFGARPPIKYSIGRKEWYWMEE